MTNAVAVDDEDAAEAAAGEKPRAECRTSSLVLGIFIGLGIGGVIALVSKARGGRKDDHPRITRAR
jgi:hypothetical protein